MAEEYTIGDVAKFLKKIRRKRHQKQDELGDTNPLSLVFGKSPCCSNNKSFYQNYRSLSKGHTDHNSSASEEDDESASDDRDEDSDDASYEEEEKDESGEEGNSEEEDVSTKPERTEDAGKVQSKPKKKPKKKQPLIPRDKRTIFVGNIPTEVQKKALKKHFLEYGPVETVRMRSLAPAQQGMSQKVVGKTQDINSKRKSYNAYVVFTTIEAAHNALEKNGTSFQGHHLRVDLTDAGKKDHQLDSKKSVFLGSLPYGVNEEDIRRHFKEFGELESVRVVRDATTGMGKGFGFLVFKDPSSVALALKMKSQKLNGRRIRIKAMENKQNQQERPIVGDAREKDLSNAERRINQKSLKRIRYKKKIKKKPQQTGPLDNISKKRAGTEHTSVPRQNHPSQKHFNTKQSSSNSKQRRQGEKTNAGKGPSKKKRQHDGPKSYSGKKTTFT